MHRTSSVMLGVTALGLISWVSVGRTDTPHQNQQGEAKLENRTTAVSAADLIRKLATPVSLPDRFDTPLGDAVRTLEEMYGVSILFDELGFMNDLQDPDVKSKNVKLEKLSRVRLSTVLQKLVDQVQGGYLIKPDHISILPQSRLQVLVWGSAEALQGPDGETRPRLPVVHAVFDHRPLNEALKELSDLSGVSVLLDSRRAGDQAKAAVTATLLNAPIDTAVKVLANQAELDAVLLDNVLYVTTAENAVALRPARQQMAPLGFGGGLGGGVGVLAK